MKPRTGNERGVALLTTLLILILIIVLANEIFRLGARSAQTSAYGRDSVRSAMLADAGISAAGVALREDAKNNSYDTLDEFWAQPTPQLELGEGSISVFVEDEERKINLNRLVMPNGNAPDEDRVAVFRAFLRHMGIDPSLADAFVDWLDNDDTPRVGGAESNYYLS
ncbi:MAG: general secretion pathway protein GspK, partial [Syntrophorhabdaceae bacterium]|nr:general secretion pathway protein GspK [Syntrophorhabdaceae bacterium]